MGGEKSECDVANAGSPCSGELYRRLFWVMAEDKREGEHGEKDHEGGWFRLKEFKK